MSNCVYTIDGKKYSLPEFKAFLAEGGLERLYPDGGYSWLEKSKEKKLPTAKEAHDFVVSHIQAAKTDDYKEAYSSAKEAFKNQFGVPESDVFAGGNFLRGSDFERAVHDGVYQVIKDRGAALPVPVKETDVNKSTFIRAYEGISHSPDERGESQVRDYVRSMVSTYEALAAKAKTDSQKQVLNDWFEGYKAKYIEKLNAYMAAQGRVMSSMITGPARFPVASNQKKSNAADARMSELLEYHKKAVKSIEKAIANDGKIPRTPLEEAKANLASREKAQEIMKAANAVIRNKKLSNEQKIEKLVELGVKQDSAGALLHPDYAGRLGYASYNLTNNLAEIKRLQGRVKELEAKEQAKEEQKAGKEEVYTFEGGRVEVNRVDDRVRIFHDEKPPREVIASLKSKAFKWSPSNQAWQRQITSNAINAALELTGAKPETEQPKDSKATQQAVTQENRFASMDEALNDAEKELRKLSKQQETEGDVLLGNGKYVAFDDALRIAKEGIESGALRPAPFQLHDRLDISMRDVDRILAAVNTQKYSKGQSTGSTVAEITSLLPKRVKAMLDSGKLKVVQSHANSQVEGYTDGDTIVLVADRLNVDNLNSVLSHELIHYGLSNDPKLKAAYDRFQGHLQARFNAAAKGHGTKADKDAYNRVMAANTPAKDRIEEFGAYLVSQYQTNPQSLSESLKKAIRDFIAAIRAFLLRNGLDGGYIKSLTPADLAALSKYGSRPLRGNARNGDGVMASAKPIPETLTIDGKERSTRNSNGQLIAQTEEGIRNFWLWFGDSRVTDASGRPLVVYHGTFADFSIFNRERLGENTEFNASDSSYAETAKIGFWFNTNPMGRSPDKYGAGYEIDMPVYLKIESPRQEVNLDFLAQGLFYKNGEEYKNDTIEEGADGIVLSDEEFGGLSYVVFDSSQIKSAIGNVGDFNPNNPDIRYSIAPNQKSPLWKRWFGNSKMVTGGEPIRFYHGSNADFTVFDKSKLGTNTTHTTAGLGHFFTRNRDEAARYGEKVHEVFLSIEKPYVVTSDLLNERMGKDAATFAEKLKSQGYDGIYIKDAGYAIAFNSNQAKLTSNNAPSFGEDIRYSMAMPEDTVKDIAGIEYSTAQNLLKKFKRMTGKGRISARQIGLSALTQGQLVEVGKEILPMLQRFAVMRNHYDTTESFWHKQGDDIAQRWERLAPNYKPMSAAWKSRNRLEQRRLADMMHDMTVFGIDPRIPMGKNTVPEGWTLADLRETYNDLKSRYDQLLPATKTLLDDAEKFHMDVSNELVNSLIDKINDGNLPEDVQMSLAAKIKAQFKQQQGPYFPLMRFGSYWVDHAQGVNFFETKSEQDDFIANLKDDGVTVNGSGKSLKNFNTVEGVDAGFVQDVEELIDKLDIEQAAELKDEIFQLYLARLPENSMRKRFIHRKKTPGYEQDALRSFSKKAFHDGKQLAKVKYAPELRKVLADAKEIMEVGNSGKQYGKVERKIKVIPDILDQLENGVEFSKILTKYEKDVDWLRQFNRYKNQDELEKALGDYLNRQQDLLKQADDYNAHDAAETTADILDALQTSYNNMMQSNTSPVANLINQSVFTWFLGFNPSSALINLLQTPGVSMPVLGGRHGMDKAGLQMARAYKDFFGNKFTIEPALKNKGEAAMFDALTKNGTFDRTRSHDLAGLSEEGVTRGTFMRDFMSMSTAMFHYAEIANREITALAAYRLEYAKTQDVEKSIQYANDVVKQTHLDYSSANRPDLFQGNAARVMLQFKMYSQGMTYLWGKQLYDAFKSQSSERKAEARRTILAMIGVQTSIAGVLGLPIGGLLMAASMLMGMMDDDDDPKDPETEIRKALNDWLGSDLGRIVSHGVASETGIDFASRLSLADLWIREPDRELEGKDAATYILETVVGPIGGIINNITTGLKTMRDGNVERGAEKLLPSFAAAPMKAIRMIEDGGATSMAGNMIYETNAYEKALQALGFRASGARERFDQNSAIMNRKMAITTTKSRLVAKAARAQMQGDKAALSEVMKDIEGFNQRNPDYRITPKTISASIKHRTTNSRKAENGLVFDRRMKRIAEEEDFLN